MRLPSVRLPAVLASLLCAAAPQAGAAPSACELAMAAVERRAQALGVQVEVHCRGQGAYLQPSRHTAEPIQDPAVAAPPMVSGPQGWPLAWRTASGARQAVQVPLNVQWIAPVWTLTRALPAGTLLAPDDVRIETLPWPPGMALTLASPAQRPVGKLARALPAGTPLNLGQLLPADLLPRGEAVTALVGEGAVSLQRPARLLDAARPGDEVRIQLQGQAAVLQGRLDAQHIVRVGTP